MTRRRGWMIGAAGALVLALALAIGVWAWQGSTRSATAAETATEYLQALESGDTDAVRATGIDVSAEALSAFGGAVEHIEDAEVTDIREAKGRATAEVAFTLSQRQQTARLELSKVDGRWTVDTSGTGTATVTATVGSAISIGGASLPTGEAVRLLPAVYPVAAVPAELLDGKARVSVLPGSETDAVVEAALRPEATEVAQTTLDAHLETCTAPATTLPSGCGIRIPWGTEFREVSEIRYRIERLPTVSLTATEFTAEGGVLVATVSGKGQDAAARTTTYRTETWSLRGDVSFTADDLTLAAW